MCLTSWSYWYYEIDSANAGANVGLSIHASLCAVQVCSSVYVRSVSEVPISTDECVLGQWFPKTDVDTWPFDDIITRYHFLNTFMKTECTWSMTAWYVYLQTLCNFWINDLCSYFCNCVKMEASCCSVLTPTINLCLRQCSRNAARQISASATVMENPSWQIWATPVSRTALLRDSQRRSPEISSNPNLCNLSPGPRIVSWTMSPSMQRSVRHHYNGTMAQKRLSG